MVVVDGMQEVVGSIPFASTSPEQGLYNQMARHTREGSLRGSQATSFLTRLNVVTARSDGRCPIGLALFAVGAPGRPRRLDCHRHPSLPARPVCCGLSHRKRN
jgi:hypothetical protein